MTCGTIVKAWCLHNFISKGVENVNETERIFDEILTPNISIVTLKISKNLSKTQTPKNAPRNKEQKNYAWQHYGQTIANQR